MDEDKLLNWPTNKLLAKFGQGSHKPGSGSAVAFQAMIATQLMHTVIALTNEDKGTRREDYQHILRELLEIDEKIMNQIYPSLEVLFQRDAFLFDNVIKLRVQRDNEQDPLLKDNLIKKCKEALVLATDILLVIADHCADLTDAAVVVFDKGFKPAKGDSAAAMNGSLGALAGCLSIIDLNLSSFGVNAWTAKTRETLERLRLDYLSLDKGVKTRLGDYAVLSRNKSFNNAKKDLASGKWSGVRSSEARIESIANEVHDLLWEFRDMIWKENVPKTRYEILRADVVIEKILGYQFRFADLGIFNDGETIFKVAGEIDRAAKIVVISNDLVPEVQNFTIAHELGHALLHDGMTVLHRERPLEGGSIGPKDVIEKEADKFASCFLMPASIVEMAFREMFDMNKFTITTNTLFKLGEKSLSDFRKKHQTLRSISKFVAKYKRGVYRPLHVVFGVSVEAMAIRLETLGLVQD